MHDAKGRELKVGDRVMVPCEVKGVYSTPDFCNVTLEGLATMPPSHTSKITVTANTKQVLRANPGDDLVFELVLDGPEARIQ
jgi:hypothetical protein